MEYSLSHQTRRGAELDKQLEKLLAKAGKVIPKGRVMHNMMNVLGRMLCENGVFWEAKKYHI